MAGSRGEIMDGLFTSIPRRDRLGLFDDGNPKGTAIVAFLELRNQDVAKAANVARSSVRYDLRMPDVLKDWLLQVGTAIDLVAEFFDDSKKASLWFRTPNPLLGNITPIEMIRMGRIKKLLNVIQTAIEENR